MKAARSVPGASRRSMRVSCPPRPNRSCAAPMSITASAAPPAATLPATCSGCAARAARSCSSIAAASPQPTAARGGVEEHLARREQREAVRVLARAAASAPARWSAAPAHRRRSRAAAARRSPTASATRLQSRAPGWRAPPADARATRANTRLVEAALRGAQFQVGLAVDRAHRAGELVERRGVDQLHREGQRHAQHHRRPPRPRCATGGGAVPARRR